VAVGGDLGRPQAGGALSAVRLPDWDELLSPDAPWACLLHSGAGGIWLLRELAEDVDGLEARVVSGARCATFGGLVEEWSTALDAPHDVREWRELAAAAWLPSEAHAVLVTDAEHLLALERAALPRVLGTLRDAAVAADPPLRVVFQTTVADDSSFALFHEFDVAAVR
jgi:hypothetical protein